MSSFLFLCVLISPIFAQVHEIAITIDDLPFVGTTHNKPGNLQREQERFMKIMQSLIDHQVPATGFVVGGTIEQGQWQLLEDFKKAGFVIGNHTYSHANLNRTNPKQYINDIARADQILTPLMSKPKYFRYPYLAEGKGEAKQEVQNFLIENDYIIAPVTIDSKDFRFNEQLLAINWRERNKYLNQIKKRYLDYIWQQTLRAEKKSQDKPVSKQILLIHANLLNSHAMGDIIQMYKDHGYQFVSLSEVLSPTDASTSTASSIPPIPLPLPDSV
ncbi:putative xylanase/chitin deacetylase [Legionella oakridgensis ATCC 33761 = DSM 21215]|uniref:Putative xylanase/chitin deacetylase n=1 Tax=Legionella oakridgensis ATCC 33761 = DSM 21215 TaxID=1268635 RepID=W0BGG6_9GAMM|nr:polysaccharide deacetylase family protein [Legionella oakridgensis]AHE67529.1 putative xylanase/chitin deacetylase [Legionella oakridgensis ATCC 33761 = DSM 21215]